MATLTSTDRQECCADYIRDCGSSRSSLAILKADLRAAIDAADTWANNNAALYNAALPLPARNQLNAEQKARLLAAVIVKRFQKGV